jgi:hypothetical protein
MKDKHFFDWSFYRAFRKNREKLLLFRSGKQGIAGIFSRKKKRILYKNRSARYGISKESMERTGKNSLWRNPQL